MTTVLAEVSFSKQPDTPGCSSGIIPLSQVKLLIANNELCEKQQHSQKQEFFVIVV
jgi:hypothetical protein